MSADVTVFVPTFRRAELLRECLHSLLDQGLPADDYVVLVSDNASPDHTADVVRSFEDRLQLRYHRRPETVSPAENINGAGELPETPYVSILCDDDVLAPGQLGRAMACLRRRPEASLYAAVGLSAARWGDAGGKPLGMLLDLDPEPDDPFLFRWSPAAWAANCSLHTPVTFLGSVFRLDRIPIRPVFDPQFPQEGDRVLFLSMLGSGEIYSAPWIGGYLRAHEDRLTVQQSGQREETDRVTALALERAAALDIDLVAFWVERLPRLGGDAFHLISRRIRRRYPAALARSILEAPPVVERAGDLRDARQQRRRARRGLGARLQRWLGRRP